MEVEIKQFDARWTAAEWLAYLDAAENPEDEEAIRKHTHTGRPLGTAAFVERLEQATRRRLTPQKGGRPRKKHGEVKTGVSSRP